MGLGLLTLPGLQHIVLPKSCPNLAREVTPQSHTHGDARTHRTVPWGPILQGTLPMHAASVRPIHPVACLFFPVQVFRTDLITAMKIPDSFQLSPDEYYVLADPWRQEWEKGVQVPASAEAIPEPVVR